MNPPDDKPPADARVLWDRVFSAYLSGVASGVCEERAAAVLAPVLRDRDHFLALANSQKAQRELAERERDDLRAEVERLKEERNDWQEQAERERAERQKEVGAQEYRGNTVSYIYDKERAYGAHFDRMRTEIADLRAQLAAAQAQAREAMEDKERLRAKVAAVKQDCYLASCAAEERGDQLNLAEKQIADLRTQLAAAQADKERLDWLITQGPESDGIGLNDKAWDAAIDLNKDTDHEAIRAAIDAARQQEPRHD